MILTPNTQQAGKLDRFLSVIRQIESSNPRATPAQILVIASAYIDENADDAGNSRYVYTTEGGLD